MPITSRRAMMVGLSEMSPAWCMRLLKAEKISALGNTHIKSNRYFMQVHSLHKTRRLEGLNGASKKPSKDGKRRTRWGQRAVERSIGWTKYAGHFIAGETLCATPRVGFRNRKRNWPTHRVTCRSGPRAHLAAVRCGSISLKKYQDLDQWEKAR